MSYIKRFLMVAIFLSAGSNNSAAAPQFPRAQDTVCLPVYTLKDGRTLAAGKCSAVYLPNSKRSVLISVIHAFGVDGGLKASIPAEQLPGLVSKVVLIEPIDGRNIGEAGPELLKVGDGASEDYSEDLVAFQLSHSPKRILNLAGTPASVGSRCWLLTYVQPNNPKEFSGTVISSTATKMVFKPDQPFITQATSGSPVVNEKGDVIGMLVAHNSKGDISCNPGYRIRQRLQSEVR